MRQRGSGRSAGRQTVSGGVTPQWVRGRLWGAYCPECAWSVTLQCDCVLYIYYSRITRAHVLMAPMLWLLLAAPPSVPFTHIKWVPALPAQHLIQARSNSSFYMHVICPDIGQP